MRHVCGCKTFYYLDKTNLYLYIGQSDKNMSLQLQNSHYCNSIKTAIIILKTLTFFKVLLKNYTNVLKQIYDALSFSTNFLHLSCLFCFLLFSPHMEQCFDVWNKTHLYFGNARVFDWNLLTFQSSKMQLHFFFSISLICSSCVLWHWIKKTKTKHKMPDERISQSWNPLLLQLRVVLFSSRCFLNHPPKGKKSMQKKYIFITYLKLF